MGKSDVHETRQIIHQLRKDFDETINSLSKNCSFGTKLVTPHQRVRKSEKNDIFPVSLRLISQEHKAGNNEGMYFVHAQWIFSPFKEAEK